MFNKWKEYLFSLIKSRMIYLILLFVFGFGFLIYRIFTLQIVNGKDYLNNFQMKIKKEISIDAARGNIYDCNGVLLAYNELAYSVTIEDVYDSGSDKNKKLNNTILKTIDLIESNGDTISCDFNIILDDNNNYQFTVTGGKLNRFKADIYGRAYVDDMLYAESSSTADDIIEYLASKKRFNIDTENISKDKVLKIVAIRYAMSLNAYQKYISTTISNNVSDKTVAVIYENSDILKGVTIAEDTIRVYPKGIYTSQIVGYTGKISPDELSLYSESDSSYSLNDIVGKTGIEQSMEAKLRGIKGSETIYVNTTGKVISSENYVDSIAGNNVYLSIDSKLQESIYKILEQKLAGILLRKIVNAKEYIPTENSTSSDILIPIYDVYYACINNSVLDIDHFAKDDASDSEKLIYEAYVTKKEDVLSRLETELLEKKTPYNKLTTEFKNYQNHIEKIMLNKGILISDKISNSDDVYIDWAVNETISLSEYIKYAISQSWINNDLLKLDDEYSESDEIYKSIVSIVMEELKSDIDFDKILYRYIIKNDMIQPRYICQALLDQKVVFLSDKELESWNSGGITSFQFMINRIENLDITPAMLALEPYSASLVITDVNTGKVKALVSYPSYDNNYLANGADPKYLKKITSDLSMPMVNYATQQRTAPGSTFKMVSSTAGLLENVVTPSSLITCTGSFEVTTDTHKCWVYPRSHGPLNMAGAIHKSCNCFFYNVAYRLSMEENGEYNSSLGVEKLNNYASMFGLGDKSGIEIDEYSPVLTQAYSVPSAIGQGTYSFTTVQLARYVTAVANKGTVYDLTLLDKITDSNENVIEECQASIKNEIEMSDTNWATIHEGMRGVVAEKSYYSEIPFELAGKTGTAQQSKVDPDHGLFVCFAPFNNPEIAIACRIANGYTSDFASNTTKDVIKYYYNIDEVVTGSASSISTANVTGD